MTGRKKAGVVLVTAACLFAILTLSYDLLKGEGSVTLGPKSIPALAVAAVVLAAGAALMCGAARSPAGDEERDASSDEKTAS